MMGHEGAESGAGEVAAVFGVLGCTGVVGCTASTGVDGMGDKTGNTYMMTINQILDKAHVGFIIFYLMESQRFCSTCSNYRRIST